ncbi:MAG: GntR family transcriptional regulator [Eggerthella lenta]
MVIRIDQKSEEPLYLQIRSQIIAAIATGELVPGTALPSVRALASDLGINLHTVNKAYAVLRDEGYDAMRGRSAPTSPARARTIRADRAQIELAKMEDGLFELALAHRARGGTWGEFWVRAARARARHGAGERSDARTAQASRDAQGGGIERAASCEPAFKGVRCSGRVRPDRHNGRYGIAHAGHRRVHSHHPVPHAPRRCSRSPFPPPSSTIRTS